MGILHFAGHFWSFGSNTKNFRIFRTKKKIKVKGIFHLDTNIWPAMLLTVVFWFPILISILNDSKEIVQFKYKTSLILQKIINTMHSKMN